MESEEHAHRPIDVSWPLQDAILKIARCRDAALDGMPWHRVPGDVCMSIIEVGQAQWNTDFEHDVFCMADPFIRASGQSSGLFPAGEMVAASAHQLAVLIRADFVHRLFGGNLHDMLWTGEDKATFDEFFCRLIKQIDEEEPGFVWNELRQIPAFDPLVFRVQLEREFAFAEAEIGSVSTAAVDLRKQTSSPLPVDDELALIPKVYLFGWPDILEAVGLKNNDTDKNKVLGLDKQYQGPIPQVERGGKPRVEKGRLLDWWNGLEEKFQASDAALKDKAATVEEQYQHGSDGTVVPLIGGHVKKRRSTGNAKPPTDGP